jgi:hypothetical protein
MVRYFWGYLGTPEPVLDEILDERIFPLFRLSWRSSHLIVQCGLDRGRLQESHPYPVPDTDAPMTTDTVSLYPR